MNFQATTTASTVLGAFTTIGSVSVVVRNPTGSPKNLQADITCTDAGGTHTGSTNNNPVIDPSGTDTTFKPVTATFLAGVKVDCDTSSLQFLSINFVGQSGDLTFAGNYNLNLLTGITVGTGTTPGTGTQYEGFNMIIGINDNLASQANEITQSVALCPATNFSVFGADFGLGFCQIMRYLFIPNQTTLNQWTDSKDLMATKAPLSYFYDLTTNFGSLATTSTATITPLTLKLSTSTPISFSIDMFSENTIDKFTNSTARGIIRTLIQYSLYVAFVAMIILEIRHIFKKNDQVK